VQRRAATFFVEKCIGLTDYPTIEAVNRVYLAENLKKAQMPIDLRVFIMLQLAVAVAAFASTTKSDTALETGLLQSVQNRFGQLSLAEQKVVDAALTGQRAECGDLSKDDNKIRGDLLAWLCTDPRAATQVNPRGISIFYGKILKVVDLEGAKILFPIQAVDCAFEGAINLSDSEVAFFNLSATSGQLWAENAHFKGSLWLRNGFKGEVNLSGAKIDADLVCEDGQFVLIDDSVLGSPLNPKC
jgi:hypothetical protein